MKYTSCTPLNSARDAGTRINRYGLSSEAIALLDDLQVPHDSTIWEAQLLIEDKMMRMNPEQRRELLQRMAVLNLKDAS